MCSDKYTLRLSNVAHSANANLVTLNADLSEYTVRIPEFLRKKGKCKLTVQNCIIQVKNANGTSIVPANTHTAVIEVDGLNLLGYSNQNGAGPVSLCEMPIDSSKNDITLINQLTYTCLDIAPTVTIKRKCYKSTTPFLPVVMAEQDDNVVPMILSLSLEFEEDQKK